MRKRRSERADQYQSATYRALLARLASNVRGLRACNQWTQEEAAHRCGMAPQVLQRIEAGTTNVTFTTLARLCDGFETDVSRLIRGGPAGRTGAACHGACIAVRCDLRGQP